MRASVGFELAWQGYLGKAPGAHNVRITNATTGLCPGGEELGPGGGAAIGPVEAAGILVGVESGGDAAAGELRGGGALRRGARDGGPWSAKRGKRQP
jgi:hypothetical protein